MRVLIIDDDPDLRGLLSHYIRQRWGDATVDEWDPLERDMPAADFPLGSYQALILDYMLGRGDGLDWLAKLKQRSDCPKVLFLTGAGNESIAVRAMKAGADDYQRKQELTRERLLTSLHELTAGENERTVSRELAARMEAHALVERIQSRHVARIYDHGQSEEHAYLVMEFFEGGDLMKRLAGTALEPGEAMRIFRELMFALGDIHEKGILHRDLKPQNLMFRQDGTLAILDFGIAKHIDAIDRTKEGEVLGTPRYMSPEQVQGRALDLRTDIYSAGVLLYQMLTGQHLFEGETAVEVALHHLNTEPPALPERLAVYQRLLDKLVEKDRDARFRNADEVIGFLSRKFEEGLPP